MKWCFLVNDASFFMEFLGKIAHQVVLEGDECLVLYTHKTSEYGKKKYFPSQAKFISKVDWCIDSYDSSKREFGGLSWKDFAHLVYRFPKVRFEYERSLEIVNQWYQFFDFVFQKEKPDLVISEPMTGLLGKTAYYFTQLHNAAYVGLIESKMDGLAFHDVGWTDTRYEASFQSLKESDISSEEKVYIKNWIEQFISHSIVPLYTTIVEVRFSQFGLLLHYIKRFRERGRILLTYLRQRQQFAKYDSDSESVLKHNLLAPWNMEKRQFRIARQRRFYRRFEGDDAFFLYPLQYQPEATTSVFATYYVDQLSTIRNIAFSLPLPFKLYVKEAYSAIGTKPSAFYEELVKIPNVVLLGYEESVPQLVGASTGVITLTSTVGMEAALAGKPVYVLGEVFYTYHPLCQKVQNFDDLRERIRADINKKSSAENLESMNFRFMASYIRNTVPGSIGAASETPDTNDYKVIYQAIKQKWFQ